MRHLLHVASHSDTNAMTVEELAATFRYAVLRGDEFLRDCVHIKVYYIDLFQAFLLISLQGLVLEDLIRHVHTLFDDQPSTSPPVPSPAVDAAADTTSSTFPSGSVLDAELPLPSEVDATGTTTRRLRTTGVIPTSSPSSFSSLASDVTLESRLTPSPTALPSPLLGPNTLVEGVETNSQE